MFMGHVCPNYTEHFTNSIDECIFTLFQIGEGTNVQMWIDIAKETVRLPTCGRDC